MRFVKYSLIVGIIVLALGIYFRQTYLMVCFGGVTIVFGLLYLILGYPQRLKKKLLAKLNAGEYLTPEETSILFQLIALDEEASPSQRNPFLLDYGLYERTFIEQAHEFANRAQQKASFVPFQASWPTYEAMNGAQQRWYFYWRNQVRHGKYPKTSPSYIFVHVYELINGVGITDAQDGYDQLRRLWLNYRGVHPHLDDYLPDWLADYVVVNKLPVDPLTIFVEPDVQTDFAPSYPDLILPAFLKDGLDQIPLLLIDALTDHNITRSKFYQAGYDQLLATTLPHVIAQVDAHLKQRGKGIFERYRPKKPAPIRRVPFQSAIYDGSNKPITIAKVYPYSQHQPLRRFLTTVIKHTENLLRQQYNHRGRLRVDGLEKDIQVVIEDVVFGGTTVVKPAEFQIGEPAGPTTYAIPIPSRQDKRSILEPGKRSHLANLVVKGFFSNGKLSFAEQARELVDYREDAAEFMGFDYGIPEHNYDMMLLPQLKWYFYWRGQVREGNYLPTDQGYLFVYLRELINNIGIENPMAGYTQIRNIWLHYHKEHQSINLFARLWARDYIVVNQLPLHPLHIYAEPAMLSSVLRHEPDFAVAAHLARPLAEWPIALVERLIDHRITNSQFYQSGHAGVVDEYIPKTIGHVDGFLKKRNGQGIFDQFQPPTPEIIKHAPFYDGLYEGSIMPITIAIIYPYTRHQPLRDFLTPLVKHTENHLRELKNYRGRLRVTGLEAEIKAVVDRFMVNSRQAINPPPAKPKVEIDLSRIKQLRQESEHVFDMLQIEDEGDLIEPAKAKAEPQPVAEAPTPVSLAADAFEDEVWAKLAAQLTTPQIDVLVAIVIYEDPTAAIRQIAAEQHTMPTVLLDSINELAQDFIGDILIEAHPSPHIIDEYYVEMIEQIVVSRS